MAANSQYPPDDPYLARIRRGDFGDAPLSRVLNDVDSTILGHLTTITVRELQAGANATRIGRMLGTDGRRADLYAIEKTPQPMCLLIALQDDALTDVAAAHLYVTLPAGIRTSVNLPRGSYPYRELTNESTFWTRTVMSAIELSTKAAWPERDTRIGSSGGEGDTVGSFHAIESTRADWDRLSVTRRSDVLNKLSSTVARLWGLTRPDPGRLNCYITVGIQEAHSQRADGIVVWRPAAPESFLADTTVELLTWRSDGR